MLTQEIIIVIGKNCIFAANDEHGALHSYCLRVTQSISIHKTIKIEHYYNFLLKMVMIGL